MVRSHVRQMLNAARGDAGEPAQLAGDHFALVFHDTVRLGTEAEAHLPFEVLERRAVACDRRPAIERGLEYTQNRRAILGGRAARDEAVFTFQSPGGCRFNHVRALGRVACAPRDARPLAADCYRRITGVLRGIT